MDTESALYCAQTLPRCLRTHFPNTLRRQELASTKNAPAGAVKGYNTRAMQQSNELLMINSMADTHTRLPSNGNHPQLRRFNTEPIQVHPKLFEHIRSFQPSGSIYFQLPQQAELVQSTLRQENILAIMPAGSGRSLAFFSVLHLDQEGLFIVVTPLTALAEHMGRRLGQNHVAHGGIYPQFSAQNGQLVFVAARRAAAAALLV
ncbi:hypothetical protein IW261DRAFT_1429163 [Armillaria novae-zelandiae]|uniref:DEAD/DEAH-box helicase domain-containing protein n=1 Tax=Armillaria novae-zelandiae TaxID=153914 RepID=A0AA39N7C8_9AGAR|nr:hypothetical protein IW261DRAFT_1429163 [Armillaria novae-zelandiae]